MGTDQLMAAAIKTRDLLANYLWNEDDSGDENDLVAAYDELRDILGPSTEEGVGAPGFDAGSQRAPREEGFRGD